MKTISPSHKSCNPPREMSFLRARARIPLTAVGNRPQEPSSIWLRRHRDTGGEGEGRGEEIAIAEAAQSVAKSGPDVAQLWQFLMHNAASIELLMQ